MWEELNRPIGPVPPRRTWVWVVAAVAAVVVIAGIGAGSAVYLEHRKDVRAEEAADRRADAERAEREAEEAEARERREEAERQARAEYAACVAAVTPLLNRLSEVDARLDVGLDLDEYADKVGDASVAYDRIDGESLSGDCLDVAVTLERAYNRYASVASVWNDCVYDVYCSDDDLDGKLQPAWAAASRQLERARAALRELDPEAIHGEAS